MPRSKKAGSSREAERYKKAANASLKLLDWCIDYFAHHKEGALAEKLAQSRNNIRKRLD